MKFQYVAVDADGKKVKGVIDSENETAALYYVRSQDLSPISIKPFKEKAAHFWEIEIMEPDVHKLKMKKKDLMRFSDKMSVMLKAGVNLSMAMDVIITSEKNRRYKKIYKSVLLDLYGGLSLADSMRTYQAFPDVVVNMVASGEKNGKLDWCFGRITEMYEKELALKGKISAAFAYPGFLFALLIALFVVMTTFVLPKFANMYSDLDAKLPALTRGLLSISDFLMRYGLILLGGIAVFVGLVVLLIKTAKGFDRTLSKLLLKLPIFGRLSLVSNTSGFSRIASSLLESGVEVVESVRIATTIIKNKHIRYSVRECLEEVSLGATLHSSLAKLNIFEPLFISMIQIGEEASMLPETFHKMADMYEEESDEATRKLTSVLEPVMTLSIGLTIALMVVAMILPMFNMYNVLLGTQK